MKYLFAIAGAQVWDLGREWEKGITFLWSDSSDRYTNLHGRCIGQEMNFVLRKSRDFFLSLFASTLVSCTEKTLYFVFERDRGRGKSNKKMLDAGKRLDRHKRNECWIGCLRKNFKFKFILKNKRSFCELVVGYMINLGL
jgi:hypothetical protein